MADVDSPLTTTLALKTLQTYGASFDARTQQRGARYFKDKLVTEIWEDGDVLTASVRGSDPEPYTTTLHWDGRAWHSACTCPMEHRCKHAYGLRLAWLSRQTARATPGVMTATRMPEKKELLGRPIIPEQKVSFRSQWKPVVEDKLGRELTEYESEMLVKLSALFKVLKVQGALFRRDVTNHGFEISGMTGVDHWQAAFVGWWTKDDAPQDPWALWQYIAYDAECAGRAIPAAFAPMTDTAAIRAKLSAVMEAKEIAQLKSTLAAEMAEAIGDYGEHKNAMPVDLRIMIKEDGKGTIETRAQPDKPWKTPTAGWMKNFSYLQFTDFNALAGAARELAIFMRFEVGYSGRQTTSMVAPELLQKILTQPAFYGALVLSNGRPFVIEPETLRVVAQVDPQDDKRLVMTLILPHDDKPLPSEVRPLNQRGPALYLTEGRVWRGPRTMPKRLPISALAEPDIANALSQLKVALPETMQIKFSRVELRPLLRCWLQEPEDAFGATPSFYAQLYAHSEDPVYRKTWVGVGGWQWTQDGRPQVKSSDGNIHTFEQRAADVVAQRLGAFGLTFDFGTVSWVRAATKAFPDEFIAWRATLPADLAIEVSPNLQGLLGGPLRARAAVKITPAGASGQDWFDLSLHVETDDLTLTAEELRLLVKARGAWVRLPKRGWQRLALDEDVEPEMAATLRKLGLGADMEQISASHGVHRYHALQLAELPIDDDVLAEQLRARAAELKAQPPAKLPAGLNAELRPYQKEGYQFLAHLSALGLGGVLADDMGLGKTLQTLAWLLMLRETAEAEGRKFCALVVCPKSVVPNWVLEAARFTPALTTGRVAPGTMLPEVAITVINYVQLRLRAPELTAVNWDAVVLDEGQNIKNPASATARAARELLAKNRLVLSGTPIENRLLDLWSLLAFAQPGILGTQAMFQRLYDDRTEPAAARARLATRTRPFLLRRTKGQVARDLPARIEEEISCELEGPQRALYDAELKRAQQLLLKVKDSRQFDAQRFNILQSLLRLRQICCDPRLLGIDSADTNADVVKKRGRPVKINRVILEVDSEAETKAPLPSAKMEALLDTLEPLVAEGHRVLVFSQFVKMLELISSELAARSIAHLTLTGQTEDRQALVDRFQAADGPPVFLLSLKAAGSGLNLTAASYVVLYDPWWNPAVEAQAIDRTHRIGQKNQVNAYRLIAKGTIEEKIRALQREKATLAADVVQEESLAAVMDIESLRRILS
jgi:hypothetical protein